MGRMPLPNPLPREASSMGYRCSPATSPKVQNGSGRASKETANDWFLAIDGHDNDQSPRKGIPWFELLFFVLPITAAISWSAWLYNLDRTEISRTPIGPILSTQTVPVGRHADTITKVESEGYSLSVWGELSFPKGKPAYVIRMKSGESYLWVEGQPHMQSLLGD